jgi:nicotinamidase/pyrazinamidase
MTVLSRPSQTDILLVVDMQNDFCPGGALAVPGGAEILPLVNRIAGSFSHVALTQDWHPAGHLSFAASHQGHKPFETIRLPYGVQMLWPDHCVQGTPGAAFHEELDIPHAELILRKGFRREIDSYSAFFENDRRTRTGLAAYLHERAFRRVVICGLALDYCVRWSAEDARHLGFDVVVVEDACRAIDSAAGLAETRAALAQAGVTVIRSAAAGLG